MVKNYWLDKKKEEKEIKEAQAIYMERLMKKNKGILTRYGKKGGK